MSSSSSLVSSSSVSSRCSTGVEVGEQSKYYIAKLGGGFKHFYFHPYLGKIPILTNIFQMGWNHQLVNLCTFYYLLDTYGPDFNKSEIWCLWLFIGCSLTFIWYVLVYILHGNLQITTWNGKFSCQTSICGFNTVTWGMVLEIYLPILVMGRIILSSSHLKYWYWEELYLFTSYLDFTKFCPVRSRNNPQPEWQSYLFISSWDWSLILVKPTPE